MGKGDRRTRRGKVAAGTYGNSRPRRRKKKKSRRSTTATKGRKR